MILIHKKSGKTFYIKDTNKDFSTHFGVIKSDDLKNARIGDILKSHLGEEFIYIGENFVDKLQFIKRGPQITHQKDIGMLISLTGLSPGWRIVEGGSGSGFMTAYLANLVKPNGKVYSYEKRKDFFEISKKNIEFLGLSNYVELKNNDITKGIEEKNIDLIVLDIPEPWKVYDSAYNSLKLGGYLAIFLPDIQEVISAIHKNNIFKFLGMYESLQRKWVFKKKSFRPLNKQLVHTEFLLLFRKL